MGIEWNVVLQYFKMSNLSIPVNILKVIETKTSYKLSHKHPNSVSDLTTFNQRKFMIYFNKDK